MLILILCISFFLQILVIVIPTPPSLSSFCRSSLYNPKALLRAISPCKNAQNCVKQGGMWAVFKKLH